MGKGRGLLVALVAALTASGAVYTAAVAAADTGSVRTISALRVVSFPSGSSQGADGLSFPEGLRSGDEALILQGPSTGTGGGGHFSQKVNRSLSKHPASRATKVDPNVTSAAVSSDVASVGTSFNGLTHRDQRLANGGNQFSLEPPDQGLCVGNGFILETVNDVLRVYNTAGSPLTAPVDLNTFLGYPAQFNRTTGLQGPFVTDPHCYYDAGTNRWFHTVLTIDVDPVTGEFLGPNHIDLAVSQSGNPTEDWKVYKIPAQNDGTEGTPDHNCEGEGPEGGACIGDYPQLGADGNAIFVTTNEYSLVTLTNASFTSANIYAISKSQLASWASTPTLVQFETRDAFSDPNQPGFTVWPTKSVGSNFANAMGGTEYFLSSMAAEESHGNGHSTRLGVWAVTNTSSINSSPALQLKKNLQTVDEYSVPPLGQQKSGNNPLGECVNDTQTVIQGLGRGCWRLFFAPNQEPAHNEVLPPLLESIDSRILGTYFANGNIWGVLGTGLSVGGQLRAGVAHYIVHPSFDDAGNLLASIVSQGQFGLAGHDLLMPSVAATTNGRGIIPFTVTGSSFYPSAGFTTLSATSGVGDVQVISSGAGPDDGFTGYKAFVGDISLGARWGDYGMAVTVGKDIWVASEFIGQTCTLSQYLAAPIGSCGATRTSLANWYTRISKITP
jgi:hypothetical protein